MSLKPSVLAALCISSTLIFAGCSKSPDSDEKTPASEASKRAPSGEALLTLDRAAQQRMGLTIEPLASAQFQAEWKAQGHVIDPAALGAMAAAVTEARAASEASQSELVRVQALAASSNASERALQAAKATAARDAAQLESARVKLLGEWGAAIADRPDLPGLIQSLISMQSSLIRADLPLGQTISSTPSHVRIAALSDETNFIEVEFVGPAPAVDPQTQGTGYLLLARTTPQKLPAGAPIVAWLQMPGEPANGVIVARSAVIRHEGVPWAYVQVSDTNFVRRELSLQKPLEQGWFVSSGFKPGERIVTGGARELFSEELNRGGFMSGKRD